MTDRKKTMLEVDDRSRSPHARHRTTTYTAADHLTTVSRSCLAEQLAEHLLADIVAGVYPPESRLPAEPELADRAGVSRLTLREAIRDLRLRGVLRVQQGRGTFVNAPEQWSAFDTTVLNARAAVEEGYELALELTELRRIVERGIAELAAVRRSDADVVRLRNALDGMKTSWTKRDLDGFSAADVEFHDTLLRAAGNTFALTLYHSVDGALRRIRRRTVENPELAQQAIEFHTRLLDAVRRKARRTAGQLMDDHLQLIEDHIASRVVQAKSKRGTA